MRYRVKSCQLSKFYRPTVGDLDRLQAYYHTSKAWLDPIDEPDSYYWHDRAALERQF